jgi:hypothetical protein
MFAIPVSVFFIILERIPHKLSPSNLPHPSNQKSIKEISQGRISLALSLHIYYTIQFRTQNKCHYCPSHLRSTRLSPFFSTAQQPVVGHGLLIIEASRSHSVGNTIIGRTPLGEWSARRAELNATTPNICKRYTSIHPTEFETTIPAS